MSTGQVADGFSTIKTTLASAESDLDKFTNHHNAAAGTRLRKSMEVIVKAAKEVRKDVQEIKNQNKAV